MLGPERLGTGFVLLAMFTAPQNSIRPIPTADFVTFSDLFLLLGAGLLLPTLLQRRGRYPALFVVGAVGLSAMVLISATIGPTPALGLLYGLRLPAAAVALPLFFLAWRPQGRLIEALAWAYVSGHVVSTCYAVRRGAGAQRPLRRAHHALQLLRHRRPGGQHHAGAPLPRDTAPAPLGADASRPCSARRRSA